MWLNLRIYTCLKPQNTPDPPGLKDRIFKLLGPAIPDALGWGLLRPGILFSYIVNRIPREWRTRALEELLERREDNGSWIVFDYLFSKPPK